MSSNPAILFQAPIIGTTASDRITVETGVSFQWMPDPGDSYIADFSGLDWDVWQWYSNQITGPSSATGDVTFPGMTSSEPFLTVPASLNFHFTNGNAFSFPSWQMSYPGSATAWSYDPTTGILDPNNTGFSWDDWIGTFYSANEANYSTAHWSGNTSDTEFGHWQLAVDIHNVDIFGGAGNDTILGGQGKEMLFGGDGNDLIRASVGDELLSGGTGNDELHACIGKQTLMGGMGDDTIWGGLGAQLLLGDTGNDIIHAGSGPQTLMGGSGSDTLWGGIGLQLLEGGDGNDMIYAGFGNETLYGGLGRDRFTFSIASGHDVIADFQPGQDRIVILSHSTGQTPIYPDDLLQDLSSDNEGDTVLSVGHAFQLVVKNLPLQRVTAHPTDYFELA